MNIISIADFAKLVSERLSNPAEYSKRSLLLWNGCYTEDSIEYEIIEQCCIDYNRSHTDEQIWFRYSDLCFMDEDYSKERAFCKLKEMYGYKPCRVLFNTGCCFQTDQVEDWKGFVNARKNNYGVLPGKCVLIACAQANDYNLCEEQFSRNCDIYLLQPRADELAKWLLPSCYNEQIIRYALSYIERNGFVVRLIYWKRILSAIDDEMCDKALQSIELLPKKEFDGAIKSSAPFSGFPREDFWKFIHSFNKTEHNEQ